MMELKFKKMYPDVQLPEYATEGSACFDIKACMARDEEVWMFRGPRVISTGLMVEVPVGHVLLIFSRSGHAFNHSTRLANCVGVIDSDYRGEIKIKMQRDFISEDDGALTIRHGDRIAQGMLVEISKVQIKEVGELSETARGAGGFGSTGS
jgi:dUTP pyrophosphatase